MQYIFGILETCWSTLARCCWWYLKSYQKLPQPTVYFLFERENWVIRSVWVIETAYRLYPMWFCRWESLRMGNTATQVDFPPRTLLVWSFPLWMASHQHWFARRPRPRQRHYPHDKNRGQRMKGTQSQGENRCGYYSGQRWPLQCFEAAKTNNAHHNVRLVGFLPNGISTKLFQPSRLSIHTASRQSNHFQFLQWYHKMSLIKVAWCV